MGKIVSSITLLLIIISGLGCIIFHKYIDMSPSDIVFGTVVGVITWAYLINPLLGER